VPFVDSGEYKVLVWHEGFRMGEVIVVRGIFGVKTELNIYKSCLDGRYKVIKSVWVRMKEQFVLFYTLKKRVANCAREVV